MKPKTVKITTNHQYYMNIEEKVIVEDFKTLFETNLLPVHLNLKKQTTISFQGNTPKKKTKRINRPTISNLFCPYCLKLLCISNGSAKKNQHFPKIHNKISQKLKLNMIKMLCNEGLRYYRSVQLLSLYDKSDYENFRKLKCEEFIHSGEIDNNIDCINKPFEQEINYPDTEELKSSISIKLFELVKIDWLRISFKIDTGIPIDGFEPEATINLNVQYNHESFQLNKTDLVKIDVFPQTMLFSKMILVGMKNEVLEIIKTMDQEKKNILVESTVRYLFAYLSISSREIDIINNVIKFVIHSYNINGSVSASYRTCIKEWFLFLDYVKKDILNLNQICQCFSIMIDETSTNNEVIILVIVNYKINDKFLKKIIKLERFLEATNAENIKTWINRFMDEYKFQKAKCRGICSDGARNMQKLANIIMSECGFNFIAIHCFAHRFNLVMEHTLKICELNFCKVIVNWFGCSKTLTQYSNYIEGKQVKKPPLNCPTRWQYFEDFLVYIFKNISTIEDFINEPMNDNNIKINVENIRNTLIEDLKESKIDYSVDSNNNICLKGKNNNNIAILLGTSILFNETIIALKLLESNNVFLSDGIRIVLSHAKRVFEMKKELEKKDGKILKEYFDYEETNKSSTKGQLLLLLNTYIHELLIEFINISFEKDENTNNNYNCNSLETFMLCILKHNIDNEFFKLFVIENIEYFKIGSVEEIEGSDYFESKRNKYLEFQCVSASNSNEESLFSTMKHYYHPNCCDKTIKARTTCSFEINDMGSLCWFYKKKYPLEEYLENLERKRTSVSHSNNDL